MVNKKEIIIVSLTILILTAVVSQFDAWQSFFFTMLAVSLVVLPNILAKKFAAFKLDSEIEMKIWEIKHIPSRKKSRLNRPFPAGAFFPIISKIILFPLKNFAWMASLVFDIKPRIYRAAKRYGLYTFSEMTESHLALIAASGIVINLILAVVGYFSGFDLFSKLNIYYAFFNMLPISELDGNKIFFGNLIVWSFLASLVLIGMILSFFIV